MSNNGIIEATEVEVTDMLPSGYSFINYSSTKGTYDFNSGIWDVGAVAFGETEILLIDMLVNATGDYLNCADIINLRQIDPNLENNSSCMETSPIPVADLELTKDVDNAEPYEESNVDFTIELTNNGPSDATGVSAQDLLPSGYTYVSDTATIGVYNSDNGLWNVGTLPGGTSETLTITAYVLPVGEWTNVAQVWTANELDPDSTPANNDKYEDDQAQVVVKPIILLIIPEGFTPNGDGINDVFEIEDLEILYPNLNIKIVNRYGNLVFDYKHNGNPDQTPAWWDGSLRNNGQELSTGTYFYTIYFNNNDRKPQTGWIYLRR